MAKTKQTARRVAIKRKRHVQNVEENEEIIPKYRWHLWLIAGINDITDEERSTILGFLEEGVAKNDTYPSAWMSTHDTSLSNYL